MFPTRVKLQGSLTILENRAQSLYWAEIVQLKVDCCYIRRYRDRLSRTLTWFAVLRAVVSSTALGAWAVTRSYPMVWGGIIASAQIADAVQRAVPFSARYQGTCDILVSLDALLIDALREWDGIYAGKLTEDEISRRRHGLLKLKHEAETKNIEGGLPPSPALSRLADEEAAAYFRATYGAGDQ